MIESKAPLNTNIINPIDKYVNFFLNIPVDCFALIAKPNPRSTKVETKNTAISKKVGCNVSKLALINFSPSKPTSTPSSSKEAIVSNQRKYSKTMPNAIYTPTSNHFFFRHYKFTAKIDRED
ncbi:hypothetical protein ES705_17422 [subsurface metagenome]